MGMGLNPLSYTIVSSGTGGSFMQTDLVVLYLLDGEMSVGCYGDVTRMRKEDIFLINSGTEYTVSGLNGAIYAVASFSIGLISQVMDRKTLMLYVNSAKDPSHSCQDLRMILQEMTTEYIMDSHQTRAALDSLMFRLLDCLIEKYQLRQGQAQTDQNETDVRMQQMMQYIINHIHGEINLSDLAAEMFVSTSTLSRIFKKNTGIYFADYVMRLRVRTSLGLLRNSDQNLTQIAMNCGFSTSAAFNRSFRKVTGMMPSEYRKQYQISVESGEKGELEQQEVREELRRKGYQYRTTANHQEFCLDLKALSPVPYRQVFCECINVGSLYGLSRANTQFHILHLQEHLHVRYVRAWNIFSEKMMVSDGRTMGHYNFDLIDQVLDFMVLHHIRPFLDLGRRPDTAIRSWGNEVYYQEEYISFTSRAIWEDVVRAFLDEIISRYGSEEVSTWIFELTRDFHQKGGRLYEDESYDFFHAWKYTHRLVREKLPGTMFGGISSAIELEKDYVVHFLKRCVREGCVPDFVSFFLYSYESASRGHTDQASPVSEIPPAIEKEHVRMMKQIMQQAGLEQCKLFLTEWNNSIGNRNFLNDSCFRAAYLVSKAIDLLDETGMMAVMAGTDWVSSYFDTNRILNGGIGLLTKDTIRKPAFYALFFLGHMGTQVLSKGENYLLTRKGNGDLYLLCHHFSWFRPNVLTDYEEVDLDRLHQIQYEDGRKLELKFSLQNLSEKGEYIVKKRSLNRQSGSILDEWGKLGYETRLNRDDVKYLQAISVPGIEMQRVSASQDGILELALELEPQEVVLLHIYAR